MSFPPVVWPNEVFRQNQGLGLTSQRSRDRMVSQIVQQLNLAPELIQAFRVTPRHVFVQQALASRAYDLTALPIGLGQTISHPQMVAQMTQALLQSIPQPHSAKVLEVGTGSGYQTAILSQLFAKVYSLERLAPLFEAACALLSALQLDNIHFALSDGHWGWPEVAQPNKPDGGFDGILVAAAPEKLPPGLVEQLKMHASLIIPLGKDGQQTLKKITRTPQGLEEITLNAASFVPLVAD